MIYLNSKIINLTNFPDGTSKFNISDGLYDNNKTTITWKFDNMGELFIVQSLVYFLKEKNVKEIDLIIPYVPNARMDKVSGDDEGFMLKYFANQINQMDFSNVFITDPHSKVTLDLINNSSELDIIDYLKNTKEKINTDFSICYPDEGAKNRYTNIVRSAFGNLPEITGIKRRDQKTGKILSLDLVGDIPRNKPVLIIDDISSYGGTFIRTAKELLTRLDDYPIYLYVTHAENSILKRSLLTEVKHDNGGKLINMMFTTGSIYRGSHPRVHVL